MFIRQARRCLLYVFSVFFIVFGLTGLLAPVRLLPALHLLPVTSAGLGELRALYGGGFTGFGLVVLAALRRPATGPGMLFAMSIILAGIATGRVVSILLDHDNHAAASDAVYELIMAASCYYESRQDFVLR
jgi:Domain of unknown function (DUF4345)